MLNLWLGCKIGGGGNMIGYMWHCMTMWFEWFLGGIFLTFTLCAVGAAMYIILEVGWKILKSLPTLYRYIRRPKGSGLR